ncbi:MAG: ATP-binding protein, partial [Candidatus Sumerlaeia bacterium]|nr:ATP-binding protein [Candidatus Sumerlaeia bacterium]
QNDYSNSLFFRDFSKPLINIRESADRIPYGSIEILYASPKGIPEIELLTERWRWITLGIILLFLLAYAGLLFGLFLPTRRVLMALDKGGEIGARYIVPPRTLLERYYNNLARDATLSVLSTTMRGMIANDSTLEQDDLGDRIPLLICELFPFEEISLLNFQKSSDSGDFVLREVISTQGVLDLDRGTQTGDWHNQPRGLSQYLGDSAQQGRSAFLTRVVRRSDQQVIVLQLQANQLPAPQNPWWIAVFEQIAAEVAFVLEKRDAQRRLILQEKNKANISLSRNLGHDLTNIIATSKLELMTVKSFLSLPRETLLQSEPKKQIFQESLESLLNNTKFLQETVNLYRSFTYLSKPRFEEVNLNELVREVSQLFQLSLSRNIKIALQLENELPTLTVEPRLLRLALFNLLNNGADAIKLVSSVESPEGTLTLVTGLTKNPGVVRLEVIDSGSGIRDHSGRLLDEHEISAIFQLGYTTKEQGTGEGLGLNWVRQIVEDFHQGEIVAQNHPGGGALFRLLLPVHHEATKPHAPT